MPDRTAYLENVRRHNADVGTSVATTFRTGGPPEHLMVFTSAADYHGASAQLGAHRVVGGGSNLLVSDDGPAGMVVALSSNASGVLDVDGSLARIDAAGNWHETALHLANLGFAGVESLVGIPGTVGGAVVQNIGAYGHEICEVIERVRVSSLSDGSTTWLRGKDCRFGYRDSLFKSAHRGRYVVIEVELNLRRDEGHVPVYRELARELDRREPGHGDGVYEPHQVHAAVLALRSSKNMVWHDDDPRTWGAGSFFVNPILGENALGQLVERLGEVPPSWMVTANRPAAATAHKVSAGWLVEKAGFGRGHRWDTVGLAPGHALGLVNITGRATSADVIDAANEIAGSVTRLSGLRLLAEPILLGFDPSIELDFDAHIEP